MQPLKQLGLTQLEQALPTLYETARQEQWTYETFFSRAIEALIEGRDRRAAERRMSAARLPTLKTLEAFDFAFQPSLSQRLLWELADLSFVQTATNVLFLGPPGTGKTHLSLALTGKRAGRRLFGAVYHALAPLSGAGECSISEFDAKASASLHHPQCAGHRRGWLHQTVAGPGSPFL